MDVSYKPPSKICTEGRGERNWGAAPNPGQETFWKKFIDNLQKL
jgi:hypothetical protein